MRGLRLGTPPMPRPLRFHRGSDPPFEQRETELYLGLQGLAVYTHGRAAREPNLGPRGQRGEQASGTEL